MEKLKLSDPTNELLTRDWWKYKCSKCGHCVQSDIHFSFSLHCIECHGDMPEVVSASKN